MVLIKCEECGKEISDKSKVCVNYGCPIEINLPTRKVIIEQKKMGFIGSGVEIYVYIDNKMVGKTKSGMRLELDLPIGKHNISIEMPTDQASQVSTNISKDGKDFIIEETTNSVHIITYIKLGFVSGTCNIESINYN